MAEKRAKQTLNVGFDIPTAIRAVLPNGRLLGSDGSVWLVRRGPLQPVADAKSVKDRIEAFVPLLAAYDELAAMAPVNMTRRAVARKNYRQTHTLLVNTPKIYTPKPGSRNSAFLKEVFPNEVTEHRVLLMAVRLKDKLGGDGGIRDAIDSVVETIVAGNTPMSDYDTDARRVDEALARCGFSIPSPEEIHLANSWWNQGRFPDTISLPHSDHMHIFSDTSAARMADDAGRNECKNWPHIPNHRSLTMAVLEDFDFSFLSPTDSLANWAVGLLADGAVAISIRGNIEPAKVTRAELRRQRKRYLDDINERYKNGKMELAEQTEMQQVLEDVEDVYATKGGSPTIVDASVLVAFDGEVEDISTVGAGSSAQMRIMNLRQSHALAEMMLCSHIRSNPLPHDMPIQNVACSGIQSLSMVGDRDGALVGFTQRDRQPVYFDPKASTNEDTGPLTAIVGSTGSGKSVFLLWKAVQYDNLGIPQIFVDPKTGSDHSPTISNIGGNISSLDQLASADGIFDPIRFSSSPEVGVELAVSMLSAIDPWGGEAKKFEVELYRALSYGVKAGAECIGEALDLAQKAKWANEALCQPVFRLAESSPTFRACVGIYPNGEALRVADGLTYIKTGQMHLELPEPGAIDSATLTQRIGMALVRMMVFGSLMALEGRGGVIHLDEAWVFLGAGKSEVQRLGRLARSQNVTVELYTQRISDALDAELDGYISRGTILPTADEAEARAALKLFNIEGTDERVAAITAKATIGGIDSVTPNWASMRALRDPVTRKVLRGTIGIVSDLAGRAAPVHIRLPDMFLKLSSTTPADVAERQRVLASAM